MNGELERIWREEVEAQLWQYPEISLEALRKPTETSQGVRFHTSKLSQYLQTDK
jgi:hypothetical protein